MVIVKFCSQWLVNNAILNFSYAENLTNSKEDRIKRPPYPTDQMEEPRITGRNENIFLLM